MELLNLLIRITARDEASDEIDKTANGAISNLINVAKKAATALASMWAVKKVVDFGKAAFDAYAEYEQLYGGIQKLYGNANMSLEQYAESVGKTVDEVSAEYARNAQAEKDMLEYATNAWRTAGMDINTYFQNATGISAALVKSLGGDTVEAAKMTDIAMRAISDNVNTFGSDAESVTNAFMGFARQNYMMLDNLKLGYAGTKTGMEELIRDANEWAAANGKAADLSIDSFADVVTAIEYIQRKQGIYGTTQREALSTIEGSVNAFKAAWQNLVAEFGKPNADIAARIGDMFTAVLGMNGEGGVLRNVVNEVGVIADNMITALGNGIRTATDWLLANGPTMLKEGFSHVFAAVGNFANSLDMGTFDLSNLIDGEKLQGALDSFTDFGTQIYNIVATWGPRIPDALSTLFSSLSSYIQENGATVLENVSALWDSVVQWIVENGPTIVSAAAENIAAVLEDLTSHGPEFAAKIATMMGDMAKWILDHGPEILNAAKEAFAGIGKAIIEHGPTILNNIGETIGKVIGAILGAVGQMFAAGMEFVGGLLDGSTEQGEAVRTWFSDLPNKLLNALGNVGSVLWDAGASIINGLWDGLKSAWGGVTEWVSGIAGWIADHKGPLDYDRRLLVPAGRAIMEGLGSGLEESFERNVVPFIGSVADDMADMLEKGIGGKLGAVGDAMQEALTPSISIPEIGSGERSAITAASRYGGNVLILNGDYNDRVGVGAVIMDTFDELMDLGLMNDTNRGVRYA